MYLPKGSIHLKKQAQKLGKDASENLNILNKKGDGHLKFSGQPRTLLRNLMSYNGQILHDPRFFVKD